MGVLIGKLGESCDLWHYVYVCNSRTNNLLASFLWWDWTFLQFLCYSFPLSIVWQFKPISVLSNTILNLKAYVIFLKIYCLQKWNAVGTKHLKTRSLWHRRPKQLRLGTILIQIKLQALVEMSKTWHRLLKCVYKHRAYHIV